MRAIRSCVCVCLAALFELAVASSASAQQAPPPTGPGGYPAAPAQEAQPPGPPPAYPPPGYPPPALQQPYATQMPGPVVRLRANHPRARLQQMQLKWVDVCTVPCGVPVDPAGLYRVGGGSLRASEPFHVPRPSGEVLVDAQVGSAVKHWVGLGIMIGGLASVGGGALYLAQGSSTSTDAFGTTTTSDAFKAVGITYLVIGIVLLAVGMPLFFTSNTSVDVR